MLDRLPEELLRLVASYTPVVHNGVSLRTAVSDRDGRHRLVVRVEMEDAAMRRVMTASVRSAVTGVPATDEASSVLAYESVDEFDVTGILLRMRLPPQTHTCNWCFNSHNKLISFGIAQTNAPLRLVCSHMAVALVK